MSGATAVSSAWGEGSRNRDNGRPAAARDEQEGLGLSLNPEHRAPTHCHWKLFQEYLGPGDNEWTRKK
jgi:hypothetical protein